MSDNEGTAGPGWLYAQGDPPGTHRYWDGTAWQGEPVPIDPTPAPPEPTPPPAAPGPPAAPVQPDSLASNPLPSAAPPVFEDTPPGFDAPPAFDAPQQPGPSFSPPSSTFEERPVVTNEPGRSKWKWAIGIVALLALGIGGCSYWVFQAVSGPIDVGNEYLAAIEAQDFDAAWALVDESCFEIGDASALAAVFADAPVSGYELETSNFRSANGVTTGSTTGTVTVNGNDDRSIQILASKPDGDWLICGFDIGEPGSG